MLENISLKFSGGSDPLITIPFEGVTIFVGPNNSGKSLVLRELDASIGSMNPIETKLLNDFEIIWPTEIQINDQIEKIRRKLPAGMSGDFSAIGNYMPNGQATASQVHRPSLLNYAKARTKEGKHQLCGGFLKHFQIRLDGRTRFDLTNDRNAGDLVEQPANILSRLFTDDELRREVRNIISDAFGVYFVIDPTNGGHLRIRLSETPPTGDEQSLGQAAREFHAKALHIKEAGDGIQAFVGILIAVLSGEYRSILVDEPEAFLHPPLARKLGHQLANIVSKRGGSMMASTHSSEFLLGCLQASQNVRVVRLEYSHGISRGKIVDSTKLAEFFRAPLIRSANVMSALFYDGVIVTESDNDRVFYSEIYHRLTEQNKGSPAILFVNAQNKQTIQDIIGPLRTFGVAAAAVVDIDILKDGGRTWTGWLDSANVPELLRTSLGQLRGDLHKEFEDARVDMKKGGVDTLETSEQLAAHHLFDDLAKYGVFVVRRGELESWLSSLKIVGKKTDWTMDALKKLGSDPRTSEYVRPEPGDVWDFLTGIVAWIKKPERAGMFRTASS